MDLRELLGRLQEYDLLLDTDSKLPNVTALVAGEPVQGSWWTHPMAHEMYRAASELRRHPDVLSIKLISGKITFIHRPLWMAVYAVAHAREPWQTRGLSKDAARLLRQADKENQLLSSGDAVRELEARLLVHARSVHTERGFHRKQVQTWKAWADSMQLDAVTLTPAEGKAQLEAVVARAERAVRGARDFAMASWQEAEVNIALAQSNQESEPNMSCIERLQIPVYPPLAAAARVQGTITATVLVASDGPLKRWSQDTRFSARQSRRRFALRRFAKLAVANPSR